MVCTIYKLLDLKTQKMESKVLRPNFYSLVFGVLRSIDLAKSLKRKNSEVRNDGFRLNCR
ncbi:MAG: hypothetical protein ACI89U_003293 [Gammaproteobacteria bacterium]|jgi:hypothetical protein